MHEAAPVIIDLATVQVWQVIVGIIGILGLSPAPWLLGLASGRIQFTAPAQKNFDERIGELKASHTLTLTEKDKTHESFTKELVSHHEDLQTRDAEKYAEMKASRDGYRVATKEQRERADRATDTAAQAVEAVQTTNHLLASLKVVSEEVAVNGSHR
jgi:hypothetical protein